MAEKETVEIKSVEIFKTGTWHGDEYTTKDLDHIVESFNEKGFEAPVKLGHNNEQEKDGQPSFGWIGRVFREGNKLLADLTDVPKRLGEAIKSKQYRQVSSEIIWNFKEGMPRVLRAVALLGADIPEVKGLAPLDRADIAFNDEVDCRVYAIDIEEDDKKKKEMEDEDELNKKEEEKKKEELKNKDKEKKKMSDEKVESLETEVKEYKDKSATETKRADEAEAKLLTIEAEAKTDKIRAFMDKVKDEGKVLPAYEAKLKSLMESAKDDAVCKFSDDGKEVESSQLETIMAIFSDMPKIIEFAELAGDGEGKEAARHDYSTKDEAGTELDRRIKIYMDKNDNVNYDTAMDKVLSSDEKLKNAYVGD
jgi:hypothetical protein